MDLSLVSSSVSDHSPAKSALSVPTPAIELPASDATKVSIRTYIAHCFNIMEH